MILGNEGFLSLTSGCGFTTWWYVSLIVGIENYEFRYGVSIASYTKCTTGSDSVIISNEYASNRGVDRLLELSSDGKINGDI